MAGVPILTYHQIDAIPPKYDGAGLRTPFRSLIVSPQSFANQMALLHQLGYRGVNMSEVMQYLRGEKTQEQHGKVVGLTFDDGYENNLIHALPVLARYGFSSTCYAVSHLSGQSNHWYAPEGLARQTLMSDAQLRQWVAAAQELGSHTQHHVNLLQCTQAQARAEIEGSKEQLQAITGVACEHFCYPYGFFDASHVHMVAQAGYQSATTVRHGRASAAHDVYQLPRLPVLKNTWRIKLWWMLG